MEPKAARREQRKQKSALVVQVFITFSQGMATMAGLFGGWGGAGLLFQMLAVGSLCSYCLLNSPLVSGCHFGQAGNAASRHLDICVFLFIKIRISDSPLF